MSSCVIHHRNTDDIGDLGGGYLGWSGPHTGREVMGGRGGPVRATVAQACGSARCAPDVGWQ